MARYEDLVVRKSATERPDVKASRRAWLRGLPVLPVLRGLLPVRRSMIGGDVTAGLTLAPWAYPR